MIVSIHSEETAEESGDAVEEGADAEEEATSFDLYLVDGCANEPKIVKENISWDEADSCGKKIEEQGATILIIGHGEDVYE